MPRQTRPEDRAITLLFEPRAIALSASASRFLGRVCRLPFCPAAGGPQRPRRSVAADSEQPPSCTTRSATRFFEGRWADVQEGIEEAGRAELLDGEGVFADLLGEEPATAATFENSLARYRLTSRARRDLMAIRGYIAANASPERGAAIVKRIRLLEVAPAQGRVRDDAPITDEVRSVSVYPYVVFYRIALGNVPQVLRVIDGRRDLGTAFLPDQASTRLFSPSGRNRARCARAPARESA